MPQVLVRLLYRNVLLYVYLHVGSFGQIPAVHLQALQGAGDPFSVQFDPHRPTLGVGHVLRITCSPGEAGRYSCHPE